MARLRLIADTGEAKMRRPEAKDPADERPHSDTREMRSRLGDFLFTGAAVLPAVLALGGRIDIALLSFVPLLVAACLLAVLLEDEPEV
jgi:hypothetical protein